MSEKVHSLLIDIAEGNMDAFGELYDSLAASVYNYACTITRNKETAEDITHDVFLQVYKHAERIVKMSKPVAYIMVATRNHAYNSLKREHRIVALQDELPDITVTETPYKKLLFEDAFSTISIKQREVVYLHLICGYPHKNIADIQNAPIVTVKWRYRKALLKLREYFALAENEKLEASCNGQI